MSVRIFALLWTFVAAAFLGAVSPAMAADPVYVMRHLQKGEGPDPSLSAEGAANARAVADLLASRGIAAVFATKTRRAQQTGAPLAARMGIAITDYDPHNPGALVEAALSAGGPVLVVGHSNTVPDLVERFGGDKPGALSEQDYGTIYVVAPGTNLVSTIALETPR